MSEEEGSKINELNVAGGGKSENKKTGHKVYKKLVTEKETQEWTWSEE